MPQLSGLPSTPQKGGPFGHLALKAVSSYAVSHTHAERKREREREREHSADSGSASVAMVARPSGLVVGAWTFRS